MANRDAFALQRSEFNPFLFAEVGADLNGMTLSVLSILARLGVDPWAEAGRLAKLPRAEAIEYLARSIRYMPMSSQSLADAVATASRLILLLPKSIPTASRFTPAAISASAGTKASPTQRWARLALLFLALGLGLTIISIVTRTPTTAGGGAVEHRAAPRTP